MEFSYDEKNFIIHLSDIETEDQYIKEISINDAENLLSNYENDYDLFAETLIVRGNQVIIWKFKHSYYKSADKNESRNWHNWENNDQMNKRKMKVKSILNNSFRKRIKTKAYNIMHSKIT